MERKNALSPAIILVGAQLGENIGTVARAMLNFGLTDLRLVSPRPGWQMERALKASAGAEALIENHRLFDTVGEATADLGYVAATTARQRDMVKPVVTPAAMASAMRAWQSENHPQSGILFGCERTGLDNDDISLADGICSVPLNPDFSSLNLAQAVLLMGYEWFQAADATPREQFELHDARPATRGEINAMFAHLESALDAAGFLAPPEKKPAGFFSGGAKNPAASSADSKWANMAFISPRVAGRASCSSNCSRGVASAAWNHSYPISNTACAKLSDEKSGLSGTEQIPSASEISSLSSPVRSQPNKMPLCG